MIPGMVYLLCAATCLLCAALLYRGYRRSHVRLLLWSSLCFVGLLGDNVMLYVDLFVFPEMSLAIWRKLPGLFGMAVLLFGLIWESE